jgi:hypothetical protein
MSQCLERFKPIVVAGVVRLRVLLINLLIIIVKRPHEPSPFLFTCGGKNGKQSVVSITFDM